MDQFNKNTERINEYVNAKKRVEKIKSFYIALFVYAIGVVIYVAKEYGGVQFYFYPLKFINNFVMTIWTIILVAKGIKLYINETIFGTSWEQQKINEFMEKDNLQTHKWT